MRKIASLALMMTLIMSLSWANEKTVDGYKLSIEQERPEAFYKCGEKINFKLQLYKDGKVFSGQKMTLFLNMDGQNRQVKTITSAAAPLTFDCTMTQPGFVLACAEFKTDSGKLVRGLCGAAVEPTKIRPAAKADKAFNDFWDEKVKMLNATPLKAKLTPSRVSAPFKDKLECFDVQVDCPGGKPVSGLLLKPVNAAKKSLPAFVSFHGAGVSSARKKYEIASLGALALDVNAHGLPNEQSRDFYSKLAKGDLKGYPYFGRNNKNESYFLGMFMRVYRALQFIKSCPEWDGKNLIIYGSSQGGGQAIVAAALDHDVTFCVARVPALCDHYGLFEKRQSGWPRFIQLDKSGKAANAEIVECARFYDVSLLAPRIKGEMLMTAGFIDTTCSPSSVYAAYNSLNCKKSIINNVKFGHYNPPVTTEEIMKVLAGKLKK